MLLSFKTPVTYKKISLTPDNYVRYEAALVNQPLAIGEYGLAFSYINFLCKFYGQAVS